MIQSTAISDFKYTDITQKIIGCAMRVHYELGNGFQEVIYQRALAIEMQEAGLTFVREYGMQIEYKGIDVGTRRADFVVEDVIIVELKALSALEKVHHAQVINYIEAYKLEVGLLINFGSKSLEFRRFVHTRIKGSAESAVLTVKRILGYMGFLLFVICNLAFGITIPHIL